MVMSYAAHSLPSTAAVGLTSAFSSRDRLARLTLLRLASSSSDQLRSLRSPLRRWAIRWSIERSAVPMFSVSEIFSQIRDHVKTAAARFRTVARSEPLNYFLYSARGYCTSRTPSGESMNDPRLDPPA